MKSTDKSKIMPHINLAGRRVDERSPCYIIAEIGSNHDRKYDQAIKLIDIAKSAGADAVKFQTFRAETLYSIFTPVPPNQKEKLFNVIKRIEIPWEWHQDLKKYCDNIGIDFCSTPFDLEAVDLLEKAGVFYYKIASSEIDDVFLLERVAQTRKPVIVSTGKANLSEVQRMVDFLKSKHCGPIALLHCVGQYPARYEDAHLRSMVTLAKTFGTIVGFSDHTLDNVASLGAVALGAKIIEKHITLDRKLPGPDHFYALEPADLKSLVEDIRHLEQSLGSPLKKVQDSEKEDKKFSNRSIHAAKDIAKGMKITRDMICIKRPALGISPWQIKQVIGKTAKTDIKADQWITKELIK